MGLTKNKYKKTLTPLTNSKQNKIENFRKTLEMMFVLGPKRSIYVSCLRRTK